VAIEAEVEEDSVVDTVDQEEHQLSLMPMIKITMTKISLPSRLEDSITTSLTMRLKPSSMVTITLITPLSSEKEEMEETTVSDLSS